MLRVEIEYYRRVAKQYSVQPCNFHPMRLYQLIEFGLTTALFRLALLAAHSEQSLQNSKNCACLQK
jgi:hypothetical protein